MKKLIAPIISLALFVYSGSALSDFKQIIKTEENKIISMNMIPTQFQFLVIDATKLKDNKEMMELLDEKLSNFTKNNGNVSQFISNNKSLLNKNEINVFEKGEKMISIAEYQKQEKLGRNKNVEIFVDKKNNKAFFQLSYVNSKNRITINKTGEISLNNNAFFNEDGVFILISYRNFK